MGPWLFFVSALCFLWAGLLAVGLITCAGVAIAKAYNQLIEEFGETPVGWWIFFGSVVVAGLITLGRFI